AACLRHDHRENTLAYLEVDYFADSGPTARLLAAYFEANPETLPASEAAQIALKRLGSPVFYMKAGLVMDEPLQASSNFNMEETVSTAAWEQRQRLRLQMRSAVEAELSELSPDERDELAIYMLRVQTGDLSYLVDDKVVGHVSGRDAEAAFGPLLPLGTKGQLALLRDERFDEAALELLCDNGQLAAEAVAYLRDTYQEDIRKAVEEGRVKSDLTRLFTLMMPEFGEAERTQLRDRLTEQLHGDARGSWGLDSYLRAVRNLPVPGDVVQAVYEGALKREIRVGGANEFLVGQGAQTQVTKLHAHYAALLAAEELTGDLASFWMHLLRTADQQQLWLGARESFAAYITRGELDATVLREWFYGGRGKWNVMTLTPTEYFKCSGVAQDDPGLQDQLSKQIIAEPSVDEIRSMRQTLAAELATDSPNLRLFSKMILGMPGIRDNETLGALRAWLTGNSGDDNWMTARGIGQLYSSLETHLSPEQIPEV
ncbi:hypothetical protein ACFL6C_04355, partial [Myxococcota bacterium]